MAEQQEQAETTQEQQQDQSGGATATKTRPTPKRPALDRMPPWKVLLHNDDVNDMGYVIETICELTTLNRQIAVQRMLEAHTKGVAMLLATHQEHAELLVEQFASKQLTVTIEKDA